MNIKPRFGLVVEYVKDIEAARQFYEEVLGLQVQRQHPAFVQFETFAIASDEPLGGGAVSEELYWLVDDVDAVFRDLSARAEISLSPRRLPFGKVFGIKNPDGRTRYLLELAEDRPSRHVEQEAGSRPQPRASGT